MILNVTAYTTLALKTSEVQALGRSGNLKKPMLLFTFVYVEECIYVIKKTATFCSPGNWMG